MAQVLVRSPRVFGQQAYSPTPIKTLVIVTLNSGITKTSWFNVRKNQQRQTSGGGGKFLKYREAFETRIKTY